MRCALGCQPLAHAERQAAEAGHRKIWLLANAAFVANIKLYKAIGYAIERTEPFMGGTTVFMGKRLGP